MRSGLRSLKAASAALAIVACLEIASPHRAEAQVYLRRNADGILEATDSPESSEFRLRFSAKGVVIHSRGFRSRARPEFDPIIEDAAAKFGVASEFIRAIIRVESSYDEFAVSSKGAKGLMQLMPATARRFGVTNPFDPEQAIMGGTEYLAYLLGLFRGNIEFAAAGYNAGENAVLRYGGVPPYRETRNYVQRVRTVLGSAPLVMSAAEARTPEAGSGTTLGFSGTLPPSLQPRAPKARAAAGASVPARAARALVTVPQRLYYRWTDEAGSTHFADAPPQDGTAYRTIRALP